MPGMTLVTPILAVDNTPHLTFFMLRPSLPPEIDWLDTAWTSARQYERDR
jgi:hypothetical protein